MSSSVIFPLAYLNPITNIADLFYHTLGLPTFHPPDDRAHLKCDLRFYPNGLIGSADLEFLIHTVQS
jgi:hypothetical protein